MKKIIALIVLLLLVVSITAVSALAGTGLVMSVECNSAETEYEAGDEIAFSIKLTSNPGIVTISGQLSYDKTVFELVSKADGGSLSGWQSDAEGDILYWDNSASKDNLTSTGLVATVTLKVKSTLTASDLKQYSVSFTPGEGGVYDVDLDDVGMTVNPAAVTLICDHTYNGGSVTTPPTCVDKGVKTFTCTKCGTSYTENVNATGHTYEVTWDVAADNESAKATFTCQNGTCTHSYSQENITATHTQEPTCNAGGKYTFTATAPTDGNLASGQTLTKEVYPAATGEHTYQVTKWNWTKTAGAYTCTCDLKCSGCTTTQTAQTCTVSGEIKKGDEATCTATGTRTWTATAPTGKTYTTTATPTDIETETVSKIAHSMTPTEAKAATCTADGNNAYYYCSACQKYYKNEAGTQETTVAAETLKATGHTYKVTWKWDSNAHTATADLECTSCSKGDTGHSCSYTTGSGVTVTGPVTTTQPGCTTKGEKTYTATTTLPGTNDKLAQGSSLKSTLIEDIDPTGHTYTLKWGTWDKNNPGEMPYTLTCSKCASGTTGHVVSGKATTQAAVTAPTCTKDGNDGYTFTVEAPEGSTISNNSEHNEGTITPALGHQYTIEWGTWDEANPTKLSYTLTCTRKDCAKTETNHTYQNTATATPKTTKATCIADGKTEYTFTATVPTGSTVTSGETTVTKTVVLPATGHTYTLKWGTWDKNNPGEMPYTLTCSKCSSSTEGHKISDKATSQAAVTAPTCTKQGVDGYTFTVEAPQGSTISNNSEHNEGTITPALGHQYTIEWGTWDEANPTKLSYTLTCTRNGCTETETNHVYTKTVTAKGKTTKATCTADGKTDYEFTATVPTGSTVTSGETTVTKTAVIPATGHTYKINAWNWAEDCSACTVSVKCSTSGCGHTDTLDCTVEENQTKYVAPSCTTAGSKTFVATRPELTEPDKYASSQTVSKTKTVTLDALGHDLENMEHYDQVDPTCTETGTKEYWVCPNCKKMFDTETPTIKTSPITKPTTIKATGHEFDQETERVEPTQGQDGYVKYRCSNINRGEQCTETKTVILHGELIHHDRVEATSTATGMKEYWECPNCHKYFSDAEGKNEVQLSDLVISKTTPKSPKTGDDTSIVLWASVLTVSALSVGAVLTLKKREF